jgi:hypothetical protein
MPLSLPFDRLAPGKSVPVQAIPGKIAVTDAALLGGEWHAGPLGRVLKHVPLRAPLALAPMRRLPGVVTPATKDSARPHVYSGWQIFHDYVLLALIQHGYNM